MIDIEAELRATERPEGGFRVLLVDYPWKFVMRSQKGVTARHAEAKYRTMTLAQVKGLRPAVDPLVAKDCHLFFWTSAPHLPEALDIMKAWGFKYSSVAFDWIKLRASQADQHFITESDFHMGMGYTTRKNAEYCLLGKRGSPKRQRADVRALVLSGLREYSRKPDEVHRRIEAYAAGPRLELFGREQRPNWTVLGNESRKFSEAAA